ncbi:hypothetical protein POJ06DRAFT_255757 [Lipomyces tetrasporus]|uniref:Uncharacterized protein n=1 Tax=Lipomyces tetrasporus TaxID=54092 RepID=A0AAD7QPC1_9ASCO|nr:uncharacterized protein POJ06DRAFT_255757 [Lipomyces tetrasporus]KAJ8099019.1 hypothetical protein POJ06DRAFT_255757 [Lipomyces tetrasporus]
MTATSEHGPPPRRLLFIQMFGPPGSGKSTMASLLARSIGGVFLNHDITRTTVSRHVPDFNAAAQLAYDLGWLLAEEMLKQGGASSSIAPATTNK